MHLPTSPINDLRSVDIARYGGCDDNSTDNSTAVTAAITAGYKRLLFPAVNGGTYKFTNPLNLNLTRGVTLEAVSSPDAGSAPVVLSYSGTGSRFIDARDARGFHLKGFEVLATDATFAGYLVDWSKVTVEPVFNYITGCALVGPSTRLARGVLTEGSHECGIYRTAFTRYDAGIVGQANDSGALGAGGMLTVDDCSFTDGGVTADLLNPTVNWRIRNTTFEPSNTGTPKAVRCLGTYADLTNSPGPFTMEACWLGDVTSTDGTSWIQGVFKAISLRDNTFSVFGGSGTRTAAFKLTGDCGVIVGSGNTFVGSNGRGLDLNSHTFAGGLWYPNFAGSTVLTYTGTMPANAIFDPTAAT